MHWSGLASERGQPFLWASWWLFRVHLSPGRFLTHGSTRFTFVESVFQPVASQLQKLRLPALMNIRDPVKPKEFVKFRLFSLTKMASQRGRSLKKQTFPSPVPQYHTGSVIGAPQELLGALLGLESGRRALLQREEQLPRLSRPRLAVCTRLGTPDCGCAWGGGGREAEWCCWVLVVWGPLRAERWVVGCGRVMPSCLAHSEGIGLGLSLTCGRHMLVSRHPLTVCPCLWAAGL